jgi:hypothetical protein
MNSFLYFLDRYLYIADEANGRIMKWTEDYSTGGTCVVGCTNTSGTAPDQLINPRYLTFDQYGNLYVTDQGNHRIQKFMMNTPPSSCPAISNQSNSFCVFL